MHFCLYIDVGIEKPQLKDIDNHVVWRWASQWEKVGRNLGIKEHFIKIIARDHHGDCERCCGKMLFNWLEQSSHPTWEKLLEALDKVPENEGTLI